MKRSTLKITLSKVAIIPEIPFSGNHNRYIRFNIARDIDEINEAIKRIETFINK